MKKVKIRKVKIRKEKKLIPAAEFFDEFEFEAAIFDALREERERQGLSLNELAQKIWVYKSGIARMETGRVNPTLTFLKKVILGLGLKLTLSKSETML